jgi:NifB/MoaA-like Fe-S oxidoreductase
VIAVPNNFYGGGVNVAGLLTGQDLLDELRGKDLGEMLFLTSSILNADGILLDDMTPEALQRELGVPLHFCDSPARLKDALK